MGGGGWGSFNAAPAKEIGHREGWAFAKGDAVEVACAGYDSLHITRVHRWHFHFARINDHSTFGFICGQSNPTA